MKIDWVQQFTKFKRMWRHTLPLITVAAVFGVGYTVHSRGGLSTDLNGSNQGVSKSVATLTPTPSPSPSPTPTTCGVLCPCVCPEGTPQGNTCEPPCRCAEGCGPGGGGDKPIIISGGSVTIDFEPDVFIQKWQDSRSLRITKECYLHPFMYQVSTTNAAGTQTTARPKLPRSGRFTMTIVTDVMSGTSNPKSITIKAVPSAGNVEGTISLDFSVEAFPLQADGTYRSATRKVVRVEVNDNDGLEGSSGINLGSACDPAGRNKCKICVDLGVYPSGGCATQ